jgi:hypothetical protein
LLDGEQRALSRSRGSIEAGGEGLPSLSFPGVVSFLNDRHIFARVVSAAERRALLVAKVNGVRPVLLLC